MFFKAKSKIIFGRLTVALPISGHKKFKMNNFNKVSEIQKSVAAHNLKLLRCYTTFAKFPRVFNRKKGFSIAIIVIMLLSVLTIMH